VSFLNASRLSSEVVVASEVSSPFVNKTISGSVTGPILANNFGYLLDANGNHVVLPANAIVLGAKCSGTATFGIGMMTDLDMPADQVVNVKVSYHQIE